MKVLINNVFVEIKNNTIPLPMSVLLGRGLFETFRTYNRKLFRFEDNLERLFVSAKKIGVDILYTKEEIREMVEKMISVFDGNEFELRLKIVALPECLIVIGKPLVIDTSMYNGVTCKSIVQTRAIPSVKSISYVSSLLANEEARKDGCFEAILLDQKKEVYEGAYSNIFWFEGDVLYTRGDDVLPGNTRKVVMELSPFEVKEKRITIDELYKVDEVFLTSSIKGIVPIVEIDGKKIGAGKPEKNTRQLMNQFAEYINGIVGEFNN